MSAPNNIDIVRKNGYRGWYVYNELEDKEYGPMSKRTAKRMAGNTEHEHVWAMSGREILQSEIDEIDRKLASYYC